MKKLISFFILMIFVVPCAIAKVVPVDNGSYSTTRYDTSRDKLPEIAPNDINRTSNLTGPVPSNSWVSGILWFKNINDQNKAQPPIYPIPLALQFSIDPQNPLVNGLRISNPQPQLVINKDGFSPGHEQAIFFKQLAPWNLTVMPTGYETMKLDKIGAWSAKLQLEDSNNPNDKINVLVAHGSPFIDFNFSQSTQNPTVKFFPRQGVPQFFYGGPQEKTTMLGVTIDGSNYGIFAPNGVSWKWDKWQTDFTLSANLPSDHPYFVIALLPDNQISTLEYYAKHAFAFIEDTNISWTYDQEKSQVITTFTAKTNNPLGGDTTPILGIYPHQWRNGALKDATFLPYTYPETVRGTIKTIASKEFQTVYTYPGILPYLPITPNTKEKQQLHAFFSKYLTTAKTYQPAFSNADTLMNTYTAGKRMNQMVQLLPVAKTLSDATDYQGLLNASEGLLERFFNASTAAKYFYYDSDLGTMIGYPSGYGSATELNDHHFHYGYFIYNAAQIALRDPNWAQSWGGMVNELIKDIADNPTIDDGAGKTHYPFMRMFDPYEGHSWASGINNNAAGPNQESSSEAMNAWAGMILWGEATHNKAIRDTGIYLYTTEMQAIDNYWFDTHGDVISPDYAKHNGPYNAPYATVLLSGGYQMGTFFSVYPIYEHAINFLPLTASSLYLGRDATYVKNNYMNAENDLANWTTKPDWQQPLWSWQDIMESYYALYNPNTALTNFINWTQTSGYQAESGDTDVHTYAWLTSLSNYGTPDFSVTADTPLYSVLQKNGKKTYLAYNAGNQPLVVHFSDGFISPPITPHQIWVRNST